MKLVLRKVETTTRERTVARAFQADLRVPDDAVGPAQRYRPRAVAATVAAEIRGEAIA
ncbi:MAG: hypothetical protein H7306_02930 [Bacteriovorax sp.]|nr:hypothetical protein [Rhizobacter sp.]